MTKDNYPLGNVELACVPQAPRGAQQIEVMFAIDANGVLYAAAEDKGAGKREQSTITAEKGLLHKEEIERVVKEAELHVEEDMKAKRRFYANNSVESHLCNLKKQLEDERKGIGDEISTSDKKKL